VTADRWAEIKAVVAGALETPAGDREAYLSCACGEDDELRREVESLLAAANTGESIPGARAAIEAAHLTFADDADSGLRAAIERTLGKEYEILRPLGRGGMGAVFLARERSLERLVAIKVLRPDLAEAVEGRERFRREARIAAQLSHPGILPMHAFGETGGIWYFVMGYVRGQSLADRLRLEGRLSASDSRRILIELADALDCAHRHGVVHRDIKPSNILLDDESGRAMLADFGISKLAGMGDSLTITGLVVGSPHYMSPEQSISSGDVDERSDLYSLGAVAYVMLAGHEPFAGVSAQELLRRRLLQDPTPLSVAAPSVPPDLAAVTMKCLSREPALRFANARELKAALVQTGDGMAGALPEAVRDLPSFAPYAVAWAVAWTALALIAVDSPRDRWLLLLLAFLVPLGLVLHVWNIGRNGLHPLELARIASWPPEWWAMWWPRALRRPSDLWARLPWQSRFVRGMLTTLFVGLPGLVLARQWLAVRGRLWSGGNVDVFFAGEVSLVLLTAAVVATGLRWASRRGLTVSESARVLFGATSPAPIWNAPHVARLLATPVDGVRPPDRDAPSDHRRAIAEAVARLSPNMGSVGAEVLRAADRLVDEIERCHRELMALSRDAGPGEVDRLTSQLAALDTSTDGDSDERRELRALVSHQLDLIRRMRARHELVSDRRGHLFSLLRGLWAHLCLLRTATDAQAASALVEQVRELCNDVGAAVAEPRATASTVRTPAQRAD
jgi:serine/threonine-protein kinase